jgi:hypothetical protein
MPYKIQAKVDGINWQEIDAAFTEREALRIASDWCYAFEWMTNPQENIRILLDGEVII